MIFNFIEKQASASKILKEKNDEKNKRTHTRRKITRAKKLGVSVEDLPSGTNLNNKNNEAYLLIIKYMKEGLNRKESTEKAVREVKGATLSTLLCNWKRYRDELREINKKNSIK